MRRIAAFLAILAAALLGSPALAQDMQSGNWQAGYGSLRTVVTESWVEEWDPQAGRWVRVSGDVAATIPDDAGMPVVTTTYVNGAQVTETRAAARYAVPAVPRPAATIVAQYGPFVVTGETRAAIIGPTDSASPRYFDAMLRDFPELAVLDMVEAPGTSNDIANLAVGRRIRAAGIATHVPRGGSVRSGAVELFLAGSTRTLEDGAQFAVHSWLDNHGREAEDFASDHPAHRLYIDYYVEMGMSEQRARAFYAMTNSVPHSAALWLGSDDMRHWLRPVSPARIAARQIAAAREQPVILPMIDYIDLSTITIAQLDLSQLDS
ncbi:MAG: alpha/beta hydrolase [Erythrobacter sp.]